jgi:hypothetical protein
MRRSPGTGLSTFTVLLVLALAGCGPSGGGARADGGNQQDPDGGQQQDSDGGNPYGDADVISGDGGLCGPNTCANPVDDLCGASEICDNGLDDDCDGQVEEDCACQPGAVQSCFRGPPGRRDQGACVDGQQTCTGDGEFAQWGPCTGGISPSGEACDSQDNNCNGCADDHPDCCNVDLACPNSGDLPEAQPFTDYVIDGTTFFGGPVQSWEWTVTGGPCDVLLAPNVSFTLTGVNAPQLTFRPTLSGDYTVHVRMVLPDGTVYECDFIVHVRGPGLRVELCWDTQGEADIDFHLHQPNNTGPWFGGEGVFTANWDCEYGNCKGSSFQAAPNWGYANSALAECVGGPEGSSWQALGFCRNPRLDIDNISDVGKAENINVDQPEQAAYRVGVHYYGGSATTHPLVNIYCGGKLMATFGAAPDLVPGFTGGGGRDNGPFWQVADVTPVVDGTGVTTGCDIQQLHPAGQTTGFKVVCAGNTSCNNNSFN